MKNLPGSRGFWRAFLLCFLWFAALVSLAVGIRVGLHSGLDFQWSGARLLARGIDPWKTYIDGDPNHEIILGHQPNYLPELYVLLLPLGRMSFPAAVALWCGINLVLLAGSLVLVARMYRLTRYNAWMLAAIMLLSVPVRVSLANSQQSLFALFFFTLAFTLATGVPRGIALGLAFAKYSFAPILVVLDALRLRWKTLLGIAVPIVLGIAIVTWMTGGSVSAIVREPLRVPRIANSTGAGDIMTMAEMLLPFLHLSADAVFSLSGVLGLACSLGVAIFLFRRRLAPELEIAVIATLTLFCLKHLIYDYVFLIFPLAVLLRWNQPSGEDSARAPHGASTQMKLIGWIAILWMLASSTIRGVLGVDYLILGLVTNGIALIVLSAILIASAETKATPVSPLQETSE